MSLWQLDPHNHFESSQTDLLVVPTYPDMICQSPSDVIVHQTIALHRHHLEWSAVYALCPHLRCVPQV